MSKINKDKFIIIRVKSHEKEEVENEAKEAGVKLSNFVRSKLGLDK